MLEFGDVILETVETMITRDWLDFAEISSPSVQLIGHEQQFAEKIHAYTVPGPSQSLERYLRRFGRTLERLNLPYPDSWRYTGVARKDDVICKLPL